MAVEVLAGPVVTHCRARVGVAGSDLDVTQIDPGIEHGRDERMAKHMRMPPDGPDSGGCCKPSQAASGCMAVHSGAAEVEQDRPVKAVTDRLVDGPPDRWWQRDQNDLAAFAAHAQHPVSMLLAQIADVRASGLEDPQAKQPEHSHKGKVVQARRLAGRGEQGLKPQVGEPPGR